MNETDKNWLLEHLFYERSMLKHTVERLTALKEGLDWNSYYESFAVHARLLTLFLTNKDTGGNNYRACDFVTDFRSRKPGPINSLTERLNAQVMHLAKKRPSTPAEGKLNSEQCRELFQWIGCEFQDFVGRLRGDVQADWHRKVGKDEVVLVVPELDTPSNKRSDECDDVGFDRGTEAAMILGKRLTRITGRLGR